MQEIPIHHPNGKKTSWKIWRFLAITLFLILLALVFWIFYVMSEHPSVSEQGEHLRKPIAKATRGQVKNFRQLQLTLSRRLGKDVAR